MIQNIEWIEKVLTEPYFSVPDVYKNVGDDKDSCPIWKTPMNYRKYSEEYVLIDSPRAGGEYIIDEYTAKQLYSLDSSSNQDLLARLTSLLVKDRLNRISKPIVSTSTIEEAKISTPLEVWERADRILNYFYQHSQPLNRRFLVLSSDNHLIDENFIGEYLKAWSESIQKDEIIYLLDYCYKQGWLDKNRSEYWLTVDGYKYLDDLNRTSIKSSQAFVAMWFDKEMNEAWTNGFRPGIEEAGYEAVRIDKKDYNDKIDDKIIVEIRRSRFIVADFTHGEKGARGGVYYEAGFAHGLGIQVIFTCREDKLNEVHFDVRQYKQIVWNSADELKTYLKNRIVATLGEGPETVYYKD